MAPGLGPDYLAQLTLVSQRQVVDTLLQPHKFGYPYLTL